MFKKGDYIKITKLKPSNNPECPTPDTKDYKPGQDNGMVSLPVDYNCEGFLIFDIEINKCVFLDRRKRNGETINGFMRTSPIVKIKDNRLETLNSIYLIEKIKI